MIFQVQVLDPSNSQTQGFGKMCFPRQCFVGSKKSHQPGLLLESDAKRFCFVII